MRLQYGTNQWDIGATTLAHRQEIVHNEAERPYKVKHTAIVNGYLSGEGQAALTTAMTTMTTALRTPFNDLTLKLDDGSNSYHYFPNRGSLSGVRITDGPNFEKNDGAEYATIRSFSFTVTVEYPTANADKILLSFEEELSFSGGGPLYTHKSALNGPPQKQLIFPQTPYVVVQSGTATGFKEYPKPGKELFPQARRKAPDIQKKSPHRRGNDYDTYWISWRYEFESATPLIGLPNRWTG